MGRKYPWRTHPEDGHYVGIEVLLLDADIRLQLRRQTDRLIDPAMVELAGLQRDTLTATLRDDGTTLVITLQDMVKPNPLGYIIRIGKKVKGVSARGTIYWS